MRTITGGQLKEMIEHNEDIRVVEVLSKDDFENYHLPKAINIPLDDHFEQEFQKQIPDKEQKIVVYCQNRSCEASERAARRLEALNYSNVLDYAEGKEDWMRRQEGIAS